MKLKLDPKRYVDKQEVFTGEMVYQIITRLEEIGLEGDILKETAGKIAFDIACMVDDTAGLEFDGIEANPYLTFFDEKANDEIIHLGGNSYCHEMVYGILNAILSGKDEPA